MEPIEVVSTAPLVAGADLQALLSASRSSGSSLAPPRPPALPTGNASCFVLHHGPAQIEAWGRDSGLAGSQRRTCDATRDC